jgi:hypothetical protein
MVSEVLFFLGKKKWGGFSMILVGKLDFLEKEQESCVFWMIKETPRRY